MENYKKITQLPKQKSLHTLKPKPKPILGKQNMHLSNACDDWISVEVSVEVSMIK